jgi:hypothetical protein
LHLSLVFKSSWKIKEFPSPAVQPFEFQFKFVNPPNVFPCSDLITHIVAPLLSHLEWKSLALKPCF